MAETKTAIEVLDDECQSVRKRYAKVGKRRQAYLRIYSESLLQRFTSMDHALSRVAELSSISTALYTIEFDEPFGSRHAKRDFYTDCFWAFSYSIFDILAHVVNQVYPIVREEMHVSFRRAVEGYKLKADKKVKKPSTLPKSLTDALAEIARSHHFKRLASYRQCSLHRRAVCTKQVRTEESVSAPYMGSTQQPSETMRAYVCDNVDAMTPTFRRKRDLAEECQRICDGVQQDSIRILRLL